jgi:hypothetical protein
MFWYLVLAHLLGDYPFQPDWLVKQKRHAWALLLHGAIHFLLMFAIVGQPRLRLLPQLLALTAAHIIVDATKSTISSRGSLSFGTSYVLDQVIHIVLIALTAFWIEADLSTGIGPQSWGWAVILAGYVFVTYTWANSERLLTTSTPQYNEEVIEQTWARMISRAALFTLAILLINGQSNVTILAAISLPYLSGKHRLRALITDLGITVLTAFIVYVAIG